MASSGTRQLGAAQRSKARSMSTEQGAAGQVAWRGGRMAWRGVARQLIQVEVLAGGAGAAAVDARLAVVHDAVVAHVWGCRV